MKEKRVPFQRRMRRLLMLLCAVSVIITALVSLIGMLLIQSAGVGAIENQTLMNLSSMTADKADLADAELGRYSDYVNFLADDIHQLYVHSDSYSKIGKDVLPSSADTPPGVYSMQRALLSRDITYEDVRGEALLFSNLEDSLASIMQEKSGEISTIYAGLESGVMISYDPDAYLSPPEEGDTEVYFNFKERPWYQKAKEEGKTIFTDVYTDVYGRGLNITCASPFYNADGDFAGVISADLLITDLYDSVVEMNIGEGAYAFLVDDNGILISPDKAEMTLDDDPDIDEATKEELLSDATGVRLTDKDIYYSYTPIPSVGWELALHMPKALMLQPVSEMQRGILILISAIIVAFLLILLIVSLLGRRFSNRLTAPILQLNEDVKQISAGNLKHRATVTGNDEVSDLAESFNEMTDTLQKHIEDLTEVTAEQERIRAELNVAAQIQSDMLPSVFPAFPNHPEFDMYASMTPAREVGGDFYDYFLVDDDHLALVMADVSGKGIPAALFMIKTCNLIRNRAKLGGTPEAILSDVNHQLCMENETYLFVTVWLGIIDLRTGDLASSNAGHEYPIIFRKDGSFKRLITDNDPPLGADEQSYYSLSRYKLDGGDALFIYTDGLTDARGEDGKRFGKDNMIRIISRHKEATAKDLLERLLSEAREYTGTTELFDDITMLLLIYYGEDHT